MIDLERAPAEPPNQILAGEEPGRALGVNEARRPDFRLPPFPACSIH